MIGFPARPTRSLQQATILLLGILAAGVVIFSDAVFAAPTALAQTTTHTSRPSCAADGSCTCDFSLGNVNNDSDDVWICTTVNTDGSTTTSTTRPSTGTTVTDTHNTDGTFAAETKADTQKGCNLLNGLNGIAECIAGGMALIIGSIALVFLTIMGFILWLVGGLFNWVVIKTVFQFGTYFGNSEGLILAWSIMRDIGNILLLFGFIFLGLMKILNNHSEFAGGRTLVNLIIFAVLLNFSLFASQVIIDASNGLAAVFTSQAGYNADDCVQTSSTGVGDTGSCANVGIAGNILKLAGVTGVWGFVENFGHLFQNAQGMAPVFIGLSIFVIMAMVVLLAGAVMLLYRAIALMFLMITSPIGFAGMAIPPLQGLARDWWHALINQAFFAPAYLLMILISLKIVETLTSSASLSNAGGNGTLADALVNGNQGFGPQIVLLFAVIIGFMVGSLMVAKKLGAIGADFAVSSASALVFGATARGTNAVVGGGAYAARRFQQRTGFGGRAGQVVVNRALRPLEKANLDLRKAGVGAPLAAAGFKPGGPAEHASFRDMKHEVDDLKSGKEGRRLAQEYKAEREKDALEEAGHHDSKNVMLSDDMRKSLQKMSVKELEALHGIKEGVSVLARNLSQDQYDNLQKSANLSDEEKRALREGRESRFSDAEVVVSTPPPAGAPAGTQPTQTKMTMAAYTLKGMRPEQVGSLPGSVVSSKAALNALTGRQLAAIDPSKLTDQERDAVVNHIQAQRAQNTTTAQEFDRLFESNPPVKNRWSGWGV